MNPTSALFPTDFFVGNRQRLRAQLDTTSPIVLTAAGLLQRSADAAFAFQQDSSFWYLTGITQPDIVLVMDGDEEYLIVPPREAIREVFDGVIEASALTARSGIKAVYTKDEGWPRLEALLKAHASVATLAASPAYHEHSGMYVNPARAALQTKMKTSNSKLTFTDIRPEVARMRMVKQPPELAALQTAIDITIDSLKDALAPDKLAAYEYEYQLDAEIARGFRYRGARGHAFDPIVAGGKNAAIIHNLSNNAPLKPDDLVVLDVGAEYAEYCADITRTVSLGGRPNSRQRAVYDAVLDVQNHACELVKPGLKLRDYEQQVAEYMGQKLVALKLIKTADHDSIRKYYPHATSHFLGIDTHDAGDYDLPLDAGMVIAVEPGIYIPEEGIGVRIEDDALITEGGVQLLSQRLPRTLTL